VRTLGVQVYLCMPLMHGEELLGTLGFGRRTVADPVVQLGQQPRLRVEPVAQRLLDAQPVLGQCRVRWACRSIFVCR
jgi:hypothetical protein